MCRTRFPTWKGTYNDDDNNDYDNNDDDNDNDNIHSVEGDLC